ASRRGSSSRLATVVLRVLRKAAAWALPRPSAMASAKLANSTVNQSHTLTPRMNPAGASPLPASAWMNRPVVRKLPTYTTNITGLRSINRGSSLRNESLIAGRTILGSNRDVLRRDMSISSGQHLQVLDDGAERQRREKGQGADQHDDADQQDDEQRSMGGQRAGTRGHQLLARQRPGNGKGRNGQPETGDEHVDGTGDVVEGGVGADSSERAAVVVPLRGEGVEDLAEAMGAGVRDRLRTGLDHHRDRREEQHDERHDEHHERGHLDLVGLDLLAQVLRRSPDHEAGDEHGDDDEGQHAVEPRAHAAENGF